MPENHHHDHDHDAHIGTALDESGFDRRSFMKLAGFAFAGAVISGCQPSRMDKAIPYLIKPEEITPGLAYWYASTCGACSAGCGILVKNRDGRPIKIEGNPDHPISRGGLCAVGQASVLGLYDSERLKHPLQNGTKSSWAHVDAAIAKDLAEIARTKGAVRFVSGSITSPTTRSAVEKFLSRFANATLVEYDALSNSSIADAHKETHGVRATPRYRFDAADVVVSFDADFLGTWISPVEFTRGYKSKRSLNGTPPSMSYHAQFESRMSLTGANADARFAVSPHNVTLALAHAASAIARKAGADTVFSTLPQLPVDAKRFESVVEKLWSARGRSLVVCGSNDLASQILTNYLNHLLGSYGTTLDLSTPSQQTRGNDAALAALVDEMQNGNIAALFVNRVNPVYDLPEGAAFAEAMKKIPLVVSFNDRADETSAGAKYICPDHHFLESWSDTEAVAGVASITQPAIAPLGGTRSLIESLSTWAGAPTNAYDAIRDEWKRTYFARQNQASDFQSFWDKAVERGFVSYEGKGASPCFAQRAIDSVRAADFGSTQASLSLVLYPKIGLRDGAHAHNPWLQELPDPVSKVTWDNYISIAPALAEKMGIAESDVVRITAEGNGKKQTLELPAYIQVGQNESTVAIALGYGRKGTERFARVGPQWFEAKPTTNGVVGKNAALFLSRKNSLLTFTASNVTIEKTGARHQLASTQIHHRLEVPKNVATAGAETREIVQQTTLAAYRNDPAAGSFHKMKNEDMWAGAHQYTGHRWGMVIDPHACTGCGACVVGCQAENNIPVVGKDEVQRNREMHWMRIDRYYEGDGDALTVSHQPMMCQHCAHAPCETVCPVLATVHSEEGLNQQVYNRCVGTRYCSNNCPYKVRHFNWFDYPHEDRLQNMSLNPDVTVRSRGVMEKCSFCVQRIQEEKIKAKSDGVPLRDGEIKTACEQSCPAQAIVFGDLNDPKSRVAALRKDPRHYQSLYEIGVDPNVGYMTIVRNSEEEQGEHHG